MDDPQPARRSTSAAEESAEPTSGVDASSSDSAIEGGEGTEVRPDHDLIRKAQQGDEDAFARLVQEHQRRAWRIARNMVPSDEDARDLVQEAFLRVFRNLDRFDFKYPFTTWLHRIVTNLAIDHLRRRRPAMSTRGVDDEEPDIDLVDEAAEAPSAPMERAETAALVQEVLDSLAPHFEAVLRLRELEGLPCNQIAEIVGATHVTVRWRLHRGRKLFQEEWERRLRLADRQAAHDSNDSNASNSVDPPAVGEHRPRGTPRER